MKTKLTGIAAVLAACWIAGLANAQEIVDFAVENNTGHTIYVDAGRRNSQIDSGQTDWFPNVEVGDTVSVRSQDDRLMFTFRAHAGLNGSTQIIGRR